MPLIVTGRQEIARLHGQIVGLDAALNQARQRIAFLEGHVEGLRSMLSDQAEQKTRQWGHEMRDFLGWADDDDVREYAERRRLQGASDEEILRELENADYK